VAEVGESSNEDGLLPFTKTTFKIIKSFTIYGERRKHIGSKLEGWEEKDEEDDEEGEVCCEVWGEVCGEM